MNPSLFGDEDHRNKKTYRAIRHDVVRNRQNKNDNLVHHPSHKEKQIRSVLSGSELRILELFSGRGNLTKIYKEFGSVEEYDMKHLKTGDSYLVFHKLIFEKKLYDVIDLDPYGFPVRFFPDIFLLIESGTMFITMPKPSVNILNGVTKTLLISYFGTQNPTISEIVTQIAVWGLCHWRKVELENIVTLKSVWRIAISVEKIKATEYTGVRNR